MWRYCKILQYTDIGTSRWKIRRFPPFVVVISFSRGTAVDLKLVHLPRTEYTMIQYNDMTLGVRAQEIWIWSIKCESLRRSGFGASNVNLHRDLNLEHRMWISCANCTDNTFFYRISIKTLILSKFLCWSACGTGTSTWIPSRSTGTTAV